MSALASTKRRSEMLGLRLASRLFVISLAAITLILMSASMMTAQTPTATVEKSAVEANAAVPETAAKTTTAPIPNTKEETEKVPATTGKTETEVAKETTGAPEATKTVPAPVQAAPCPAGSRLIKANVVAIPQAIMLNRLGATIPNGFVFALRSDTIKTGLGNLQLRPGKRPRPIALRANVGDCLEITFQNAIPASNFSNSTPESPGIATTEVSLHIQGQEWAVGPADDGSLVGKNPTSLATVPPSPIPAPTPPTGRKYTLYVKNEGTFLLYTMGDTEGDPVGHQLSRGLFGALNVQPTGAEWYRSQVTQQDLALATKKKGPDGQPLIIDYNAVYPAGSKYPDGTPIPPDTPILKMLDKNNNIVHSDLTAIITGPNAGRFPGTTGVNNPEPPCNAANNGAGATNPLFCANPSAPDRKQPYREITIIYHEVGQIATQAFPVFTDPQMRDTINAGFDGFAINYGTGGIGAEVYANRIGVGPMGPCVDCKFEEFFLSAWSVGDPAMLVDRPANSSLLPAFTTPPAEPPVPNTPPATAAPLVCSAAQLGDTGLPPDPNCANPRNPANGGNGVVPYSLKPLVKATKAFYPDDPSNVYHTYINDHTKFRIHHGGTVATHVHHQHAHQWLQSPNSDEGSYLDSQMISPGASYTLEMTFNGSGNRNKVVGDSIFHCHFYPHFAAGMWAMWRTHDTLEIGSQLDANGIPVTGTRALPDGEIMAGTPTPAVVPMPTLPMAPMPSSVFIDHGQVVYGTPGPGADPTGAKVTTNPGFPFFIPGIAGARAPHPPLDFAPDGAGGFMDGGLPRHVVTGGTIKYEKHDQFDWSKDLATMTARQLPENGTNVEQVAMKFFGTRCRPSIFPENGLAGSCPSTPVTSPNMTQNTKPTGFLLNGLPLGPQMGAPFADPAVDDNGKAINVVNGKQLKRVYQAAAIQLNVTLNKKGWHYPQQRMLALWQDVAPTMAYTPGGSGRPPEPLFFRGNSGDIIEYWHTNLVPNYYLVDDFQVRTPTDILGQHIHLVKFDVTSSDGAGNGFNYEDGTFSPDEVREMIDAIKANGPGGWTPCPGCGPTTLAPKPPPTPICGGPNPPAQCAHEWFGAQTTVQRWYLDPVVNSQNEDRTLRTVFTHDHFGPSTHQQAGLYAGLVVEPKDSVWKNADGTPMGGGKIDAAPVRPDGGPTSWAANILTTTSTSSYREFVLEFQDLQLAYDQGSRKVPDPAKDKGWRDGNHAVNPTVFPEFQQIRPRLVSTGNINPITGTQSVNYYNEPIAWRLGQFKDLSYAFDNQTALAVNPNIPNPDPWTPLMRAYQGDNVQVRTLVGAHVFAHQFNLAGPTWFAEPSWQNSGYRSNQPMGLSEHFELLFKVPSSSAPIPKPGTPVRKCPDGTSNGNCIDYFYSPSFDETGIAQGLWGIFRSYDPNATATKLAPLPNNPITPTSPVAYTTCPANLNPSQKRVYNITAVTAQKALSNRTTAPGELVFNSRIRPPTPPPPATPTDPGGNISTLLGVMFVQSDDLNPDGTLKDKVPVEPLVLRANAGDCIEVNLTNKIDPSSKVFSHNFNWPAPFNVTVPSTNATDGTVQVPAYNSKMSSYVGLHPQLLGYDAASSYGMNVGWNSKGYADQFANYNETVKYTWYAGEISRTSNGALSHTPVEFGALNLISSDPMFQHPNGVFGQMIIEPPGSKWECGNPDNKGPCDGGSGNSRTSATITLPTGQFFREFSIMLSDALITSAPQPINAINYRTEPVFQRFLNAAPGATDLSCMTSNMLPDPSNPTTPIGEPQTPVFIAKPGDQVRFRMTHPLGTGNSEVFTVHGHAWQKNPYQNNSTTIAPNNLSQWIGSRDNHGSTDHFDLVIPSAGGTQKREGDYLYTTYLPADASAGSWGIFRVTPKDSLPQNPIGVCTNRPTTEAPVPTTGAPATPPTQIRDLIDRFRRRPLNPSGKP
jgi:hypothetical protein